MANIVLQEFVFIEGKHYELTIRQQSKFVWTAHGGFDGKELVGEGSSPAIAAVSWREQAEHKDE